MGVYVYVYMFFFMTLLVALGAFRKNIQIKVQALKLQTELTLSKQCHSETA